MTNYDDDIQDYVATTDATYEREMRNRTLEEVAKEFEKMQAFEKDTMASFTAYVRGMKR